jgi:hypothetical protein
VLECRLLVYLTTAGGYAKVEAITFRETVFLVIAIVFESAIALLVTLRPIRSLRLLQA